MLCHYSVSQCFPVDHLPSPAHIKNRKYCQANSEKLLLPWFTSLHTYWRWTSGAYIFGPDDVWSKHCSKINCWHLADVLIAGSVVQQIQEQFQQAAIGCRKQHEKQLICLYLAFLVRYTCLISLIIKARQLWKQQIRELLLKEQMGLYCLHFTLIWFWFYLEPWQKSVSEWNHTSNLQVSMVVSVCEQRLWQLSQVGFEQCGRIIGVEVTCL